MDLDSRIDRLVEFIRDNGGRLETPSGGVISYVSLTFLFVILSEQ